MAAVSPRKTRKRRATDADPAPAAPLHLTRLMGRPVGRLEWLAGLEGLEGLPADLAAACLAFLDCASFFAAARACHALQRCASRPAASPHVVEWDATRADAYFGAAGGIAACHLPESLLRLPLRRLAIESRIGQRQLDAICARMRATLQVLEVDLACGTNVSLARVADVAQLQYLHIADEADLTHADLRHLTRLTSVYAWMSLADARYMPASCLTLSVRHGAGIPIPVEHRAAWLELVQRPLHTLHLDHCAINAEVADIARHARTLRELDIGMCLTVAPLAALPLLSNLRYLADTGDAVAHDGNPADDGLSRVTQLASLTMHGLTGRFGGLACLTSLVNLRALNLIHYPTSPVDVASVARCTALTQLDVAMQYATDTPRLDTRPLTALSGLTHLGLMQCHQMLDPAELPRPLPRLEAFRSDAPAMSSEDLCAAYPTLCDACLF